MNNSKTEVELQRTHGIRAKHWEKTADTSALTVQLEDRGTFPEFVAATENLTLCRRLASERLGWVWHHRPLTKRSSLTLNDVLSRLPDVQQAYERWLGPSRLWRVTINEDDNAGTRTFQVIGPESANSNKSLKRLFYNFPHDEVRWSADGRYASAPCLAEHWPPVWNLHHGPETSRIDQLEVYAIEPLPDAVDLSKSAATFLLAYMLGMLVRYFPSRWAMLVRGGQGDAAMPTLSAAVTFIERRFPEMVVDFLEHAQRADQANDAG